MKLRKKLRMVQRRAARFVCNRYHDTSSVTDMLSQQNWESLEERRSKARLIMMYNVVHQLVAIPTTCLAPRLQVTRGNHGYKFRHIWARRECFKYSFFQRTIVTWNALPGTLVKQGNVEEFSSALDAVPLHGRSA